MKNRIFYLLLLLFICSCSSLSPAKRYAKDTKHYSYEYWERGEKTVWEKVFGEGSKDLRIKEAENQVAIHKKNLKIQKEQEQINEKVEKIKSKINN